MLSEVKIDTFTVTINQMLAVDLIGNKFVTFVDLMPMLTSPKNEFNEKNSDNNQDIKLHQLEHNWRAFDQRV